MEHPCAGDCWHEPFDYPWCHGCGEHHRAPVAEVEGGACPVDGVQIIDASAWEAATNTELPPGLVEFKRSDGAWDRYPLVEFMGEDPRA